MTGAAPGGVPYGTRVQAVTGCTVARGARYGPVQEGVVQYHTDPQAALVPVAFADGVTRMMLVVELTVIDPAPQPTPMATTVAAAMAAADPAVEAAVDEAVVPLPRTADAPAATSSPPPSRRRRAAAARSGPT